MGKELTKLAEMIREKFNPSLTDAEAMDSARALVGVYKILLDVHCKQQRGDDDCNRGKH